MCGGGDAPEIKETAQDKALADVTMEQWNRYKEVFVPIEERYMAEDMRMTPADESKIAAQVSAGVGRHVSSERDKIISGMASRGVDPTSGAGKAAVGDIGIDQGNIAGTAMARGAQAVDDQTLLNTQNAINRGRGVAEEATRDMSTLSRDATAEAIDRAYEGEEDRDAAISTAATAAGMGLAGWKNMNKGGPAGG